MGRKKKKTQANGVPRHKRTMAAPGSGKTTPEHDTTAAPTAGGSNGNGPMASGPAQGGSNPLGITDVILRDAHQSILATRFRLEDMLPIAAKLDQVGYWSLESWGGATFDACIRFLGEDPWERIRAFKKAMPNTRQQMLLRGQNLLGYRHYADDVVIRFVERAALNGVDVFRVFDAMNDPRNLKTALQAVIDTGKHAQGTISYTVSPVHTLEGWVDLACQIEDLGAQSLAIKDMAGLLTPYTAEQLVRRLKDRLSIPIHMQCHATTGMSTATIVKAAEAGIDNVDTAISSMSMTYGHSPTESVVAILSETERATGLNLELLEEIAAYFRGVRRRYAAFEGSLRGVDSRILRSQVPGGMLTNMENQLREQNATDRFDEVLAEIPQVREDLGYIPLVTPTSQIVGTQAVINVLSGERYKTLSREATGILRGEYGATPAPVNSQLRERALDGDEPVTGRPADLLEPELDKLTAELQAKLAATDGVELVGEEIDNVLTYALFPQVGWQFICKRDDPSAFESPPQADSAATPTTPPAAAASPAAAAGAGAVYEVKVGKRHYTVEVDAAGAAALQGGGGTAQPSAVAAPPPATGGAQVVPAPMAGAVLRLEVQVGQQVATDDLLMIMEAMKMETEVRTPHAGRVTRILVDAGTKVTAGQPLMEIG